MRRLVRIFLWLLGLLLVCWIFRVPIFLKTVRYEVVGERSFFYAIENQAIRQQADAWFAQHPGAELEKIVQASLDITAQNLRFSTHSTTNNPNQLGTFGATHCVGYAAYFRSVMTYLLTKCDLAKRFDVQHAIGKIHFLGIDVHPIFGTSFFRDHDFNIIRDKSGRIVLAVDASLFDYSGIEKVPVAQRF